MLGADLLEKEAATCSCSSWSRYGKLTNILSALNENLINDFLGFMRYRGPNGQMRGTMDKAAMIQDTSSESSVDGAPLPYMTPVATVSENLQNLLFHLDR